ncbi:hypothetical protein [Hymenobacter translucens]|uniref:hypothetical protein n=1 Tax=Hymenobacter translucens TaxID=2886507 RepID=UPI001D0F194B|nr:hypothetical protein [Hymenobacter translucens]
MLTRNLILAAGACQPESRSGENRASTGAGPDVGADAFLRAYEHSFYGCTATGFLICAADGGDALELYCRGRTYSLELEACLGSEHTFDVFYQGRAVGNFLYSPDFEGASDFLLFIDDPALAARLDGFRDKALQAVTDGQLPDGPEYSTRQRGRNAKKPIRQPDGLFNCKRGA